ncbi:MAG: hypothetical protein AAGN82_16865 [Myxococcota bacterium]
MSAVRPKQCPCCGAPGQPAGNRLGLIGHGLRERLQLGPDGVGEAAELVVVRVRRYLCRGCHAVITVVPQGMAPRLRYRLRGIAWALGRWWQGASSAQVRGEMSPFVHVGEEAQRGWRSLRRWARMLGAAVGLGGLVAPHRQLELVLQRLSVRALATTGELVRDAVEGVVVVDVHRVRPGGPEVPTT